MRSIINEIEVSVQRQIDFKKEAIRCIRDGIHYLELARSAAKEESGDSKTVADKHYGSSSVSFKIAIYNLNCLMPSDEDVKKLARTALRIGSMKSRVEEERRRNKGDKIRDVFISERYRDCL